jgi:hypothetical protein
MFERKTAVVKSSKSTTGYVYISTSSTPDMGLETMAFSCDSSGKVTDWAYDLGCFRYDNEEDATVGHSSMVAQFSEDQ